MVGDRLLRDWFSVGVNPLAAVMLGVGSERVSWPLACRGSDLTGMRDVRPCWGAGCWWGVMAVVSLTMSACVWGGSPCQVTLRLGLDACLPSELSLSMWPGGGAYWSCVCVDESIPNAMFSKLKLWGVFGVSSSYPDSTSLSTRWYRWRCVFLRKSGLKLLPNVPLELGREPGNRDPLLGVLGLAPE